VLEIKRRVEPEAIADACWVVAGCDSRNLLRSSGESGVKWTGGLSYKVLMGVLTPQSFFRVRPIRSVTVKFAYAPLPINIS